jgi:hypothetical protein
MARFFRWLRRAFPSSAAVVTRTGVFMTTSRGKGTVQTSRHVAPHGTILRRASSGMLLFYRAVMFRGSDEECRIGRRRNGTLRSQWLAPSAIANRTSLMHGEWFAPDGAARHPAHTQTLPFFRCHASDATIIHLPGFPLKSRQLQNFATIPVRWPFFWHRLRPSPNSSYALGLLYTNNQLPELSCPHIFNPARSAVTTFSFTRLSRLLVPSVRSLLARLTP